MFQSQGEFLSNVEQLLIRRRLLACRGRRNCVDGNRLLGSEITPLAIESHIHQRDHHGNLDQWSDDSGKRGTRIDSEDRDRGRNSEFEVVDAAVNDSVVVLE